MPCLFILISHIEAEAAKELRTINEPRQNLLAYLTWANFCSSPGYSSLE